MWMTHIIPCILSQIYIVLKQSHIFIDYYSNIDSYKQFNTNNNNNEKWWHITSLMYSNWFSINRKISLVFAHCFHNYLCSEKLKELGLWYRSKIIKSSRMPSISTISAKYLFVVKLCNLNSNIFIFEKQYKTESYFTMIKWIYIYFSNPLWILLFMSISRKSICLTIIIF